MAKTEQFTPYRFQPSEPGRGSIVINPPDKRIREAQVGLELWGVALQVAPINIPHSLLSM